MMKHFIAPLLALASLLPIRAQQPSCVYTPARQLCLLGKAVHDEPFFHRVDTLRYNDMPPAVKGLFTHSSGLAVSFVTNSSVIKARWTVPNQSQGGNMTPIMQRGLDLYIKRGGTWVFAGSAAPSGATTEATLVENMADDAEKECLLYLPLYAEITGLEVGVSESAYLRQGKNPFKGKVVVYGSSITQGASASRAGLAYPAQLSRATGWQFINMGLSGNGRLEASVGRMLADIEQVDLFILDCFANPSAEEIRERTIPFVKILREKHPDTPILFIPSPMREKGNFDLEVRDWSKAKVEAAEEQYEVLVKMGVKHLHLIRENSFVGTDHEGTIDGVHPTDVGFSRMLEHFTPVITRILEQIEQPR